MRASPCERVLAAKRARPVKGAGLTPANACSLSLVSPKGGFSVVSPKGGEVVGKKPVFTQGVEAPKIKTGIRPSFFNTLLRADEHVEYRWVTLAELEESAWK
jgi:hypothetical protein